jgi:hypothetical protein
MPAPGGEQLRLPASPRLTRFLETAARVGLDAPLAVRLALERALVLRDAQEFRMDVERIRRALSRAAAEARAVRPLGARQATYVRGLFRECPRSSVVVGESLSVAISDNLLTQVRDAVPETALHQGVVGEMLAWERAAALEGRTMMEWALKTLAALIAGR